MKNLLLFTFSFVMTLQGASALADSKPLFRIGEKVIYLNPTTRGLEYLDAVIVGLTQQPDARWEENKIRYSVRKLKSAAVEPCSVEEGYLFKTIDNAEVRIGSVVGATSSNSVAWQSPRQLEKYSIVGVSPTNGTVVIQNLKASFRAERTLGDIWFYRGCIHGLCMGRQVVDETGECGKIVGLNPGLAGGAASFIIERPRPYADRSPWETFVRKTRNEVQLKSSGVQCAH